MKNLKITKISSFFLVLKIPLLVTDMVGTTTESLKLPFAAGNCWEHLLKWKQKLFGLTHWDKHENVTSNLFCKMWSWFFVQKQNADFSIFIESYLTDKETYCLVVVPFTTMGHRNPTAAIAITWPSLVLRYDIANFEKTHFSLFTFSWKRRLFPKTTKF